MFRCLVLGVERFVATFGGLKRGRRVWVLAALLAVAAALGCWGYEGYRAGLRVTATIDSYNHTDKGVGDFYVDGTWGGNSNAHSGGGSGMCCVTIPERWHPMKVTVKWQMDPSLAWHSQQIEIPRYDKPAALQVHFMKDDVVKVVIFDRWPEDPSHPLHEELYGKGLP